MVDVTIIGGGIVGLAAAHELLKQKPSLKVILLEKEPQVGQHQTGHNSGVIHSGIYYKPGSLKAINCRRGIELLLEFCNHYDISYELCGKVIVATTEEKLHTLDMLHVRGRENG
ncbi:MAG: FAD-dependent oxidoreductase, partial [SAR202 cluster bacterium]|nr:FAD-dependent oxidoreductase [SAR202 cluster bacterium]